jgi:hypothetical protein
MIVDLIVIWLRSRAPHPQQVMPPGPKRATL